MRGIRNISVVLAVLLGALAMTAAASGHASPAGCSGTGPLVSFTPGSQLEGFGRNGDSIEVGATVSNDDQGACDVSDLTVSVVFPTPEGDASDPVRLVSGLDLPAGTAPRNLPTLASHVIDLQEGVFEAPVSLVYSFTLHSGSPDSGVDRETVESAVRITRPETSLKVTPSVESGPPPLKVTYTYELTNTSPPTPSDVGPTPAIAAWNPADPTDLIRDENCQPLVYVSGIQGSEFPPTLDPAGEGNPAETWKFSCTRTYAKPGTYASSVSVNAVSTVDGRAWPGGLRSTVETNVTGPDLAVDKSHTGDFIAGGSGEYTLRVSNGGNRPSSGMVVLADKLPKGLTATSIDGPGWECDLAVLACVRTDSLASGDSFPEVTVKVAVSKSPPASVINRAYLLNNSQYPGSNDSDEDPTKIRTPGVPAGPPNNRFVIKWAHAKPNGRVVIKVKVPGVGLILADDVKRNPDLYWPVIKRSYKAGPRKLELRPMPRFKKRLARSKKPVKVRLKVTFGPSGGLAYTKRLKIAVALG